MISVQIFPGRYFLFLLPLHYELQYRVAQNDTYNFTVLKRAGIFSVPLLSFNEGHMFFFCFSPQVETKTLGRNHNNFESGKI